MCYVYVCICTHVCVLCVHVPAFITVHVWIKNRLSVTNLSSENKLPMFRLNAPVVIRAKVKKCEQTLLFIAMHYLLVHGYKKQCW